MRKYAFMIVAALTFGADAAAGQSVQDGEQAAMAGQYVEAKDIWETVGDAASLRNLGALYLSGVLGSADYAQALTYFQQAADWGDTQAMLGIGFIYKNGLGVDANNDLAEGWFLRAAEQGLPQGQFMWARSVLDRSATNEETQKALTMMRAAAEVRFPDALASVADLMRTGTYTEQNVPLALEYYRAAAEGGLVDAWNTIGDLHLFAELGAPNIPEAIRNYQIAAQNGSTAAMYSLAYLFYNDPGADDQLLQTAFNYAQSAALVWDEEAQLLLGQMYLEGTATAKNDAQAYFWLDLAASAGVVEAHHLRALAFAGIGAEQAAAIHEEARTWFDENHAVPHTHRLLNGTHNFR